MGLFHHDYDPYYTFFMVLFCNINSAVYIFTEMKCPKEAAEIREVIDVYVYMYQFKLHCKTIHILCLG